MILLVKSISSCLFLSLVSHQTFVLLSLPDGPELIPALAILLVPLPDLHDLLGLPLGLLNLLPRLLLLHLEQGNTIRQQLCVVRSFLLVDAGFLQGACDLFDFFVLLAVVVVALAIILIVYLLLLLIAVHFLLFELLIRLLLHLWNWLGLLR